MVVLHPALVGLLVLFILYMMYQASIFLPVLGQLFQVLILFCPKFYWDIFYTNKYKGLLIWDIISKPASPAVLNIIHYCCDNATTLRDALVTATSVPCNTRDPLRIKKRYSYLAPRIPDVPDGTITSMLCILENYNCIYMAYYNWHCKSYFSDSILMLLLPARFCN